MLDVNKCPECNEYWVSYPWCGLSSCGNCGMNEDEAYDKGYFDEDDDDE